MGKPTFEAGFRIQVSDVGKLLLPDTDAWLLIPASREGMNL
jgi:hypothetical protein